MFSLLFENPALWLLFSAGKLPVIVFAISFHEAAHAWMALRCGDDTAARMGRITLNPVEHFDPVGFIAIVFFPIGWGKPVPYVERNLKDPRWDGMKIAIAGPISNVILAAISGALYVGLSQVEDPVRLLEAIKYDGILPTTMQKCIVFLIYVSAWSVYINLALCFFNLIPLFPLDGEKVLMGFLPYEQAYKLADFRQYGPMALLMLFVFGSGIIMGWIELMGTPFSVLFTLGDTLGDVWRTISVCLGILW